MVQQVQNQGLIVFHFCQLSTIHCRKSVDILIYTNLIFQRDAEHNLLKAHLKLSVKPIMLTKKTTEVNGQRHICTFAIFVNSYTGI